MKVHRKATLNVVNGVDTKQQNPFELSGHVYNVFACVCPIKSSKLFVRFGVGEIKTQRFRFLCAFCTSQTLLT